MSLRSSKTAREEHGRGPTIRSFRIVRTAPPARRSARGGWHGSALGAMASVVSDLETTGSGAGQSGSAARGRGQSSTIRRFRIVGMVSVERRSAAWRGWR